ncbi:MAG TPA: hypothetical protein PKL83_03675, partial [bacterium]|nr:hypothetical protein [bacterium]
MSSESEPIEGLVVITEAPPEASLEVLPPREAAAPAVLERFRQQAIAQMLTAPGGFIDQAGERLAEQGVNPTARVEQAPNLLELTRLLAGAGQTNDHDLNRWVASVTQQAFGLPDTSVAGLLGASAGGLPEATDAGSMALATNEAVQRAATALSLLQAGQQLSGNLTNREAVGLAALATAVGYLGMFGAMVEQAEQAEEALLTDMGAIQQKGEKQEKKAQQAREAGDEEIAQKAQSKAQRYQQMFNLMQEQLGEGIENPIDWMEEADNAWQDLEAGRISIEAYTVIEERLIRNCADWVEHYIDYVSGVSTMVEGTIREKRKVRFIGQCSGKALDFVMLTKIVFSGRVDVRLAFVTRDIIGGGYNFNHWVAIVNSQQKQPRDDGTETSTYCYYVEPTRHEFDDAEDQPEDAQAGDAIVRRVSMRPDTITDARNGHTLRGCHTYRFDERDVAREVLVTSTPTPDFDPLVVAFHLWEHGDDAMKKLAMKGLFLPDDPIRLEWAACTDSKLLPEHLKRQCALRLFEVWGSEFMFEMRGDAIEKICRIGLRLMALGRFDYALECVEIGNAYCVLSGKEPDPRLKSLEAAVEKTQKRPGPDPNPGRHAKQEKQPSAEPNLAERAPSAKAEEVRREVTWEMRRDRAIAQLREQTPPLLASQKVSEVVNLWIAMLREDEDPRVREAIWKTTAQLSCEYVVLCINTATKERPDYLPILHLDLIHFASDLYDYLGRESPVVTLRTNFGNEWCNRVEAANKTLISNKNREGSECLIRLVMVDKFWGPTGRVSYRREIGDTAYLNNQEDYAMEQWAWVLETDPAQSIEIHTRMGRCHVQMLDMILRVLSGTAVLGERNDLYSLQTRLCGIYTQDQLDPADMERLVQQAWESIWTQLDALITAYRAEKGAGAASHGIRDLLKRSEFTCLCKTNPRWWHDLADQALDTVQNIEGLGYYSDFFRKTDERYELLVARGDCEVTYSASLAGAKLYAAWEQAEAHYRRAVDRVEDPGDRRAVLAKLLDILLKLRSIEPALAIAKDILENQGSDTHTRYKETLRLAKLFLSEPERLQQDVDAGIPQTDAQSALEAALQVAADLLETITLTFDPDSSQAIGVESLQLLGQTYIAQARCADTLSADDPEQLQFARERRMTALAYVPEAVQRALLCKKKPQEIMQMVQSMVDPEAMQLAMSLGPEHEIVVWLMFVAGLARETGALGKKTEVSDGTALDLPASLSEALAEGSVILAVMSAHTSAPQLFDRIGKMEGVSEETRRACRQARLRTLETRGWGKEGRKLLGEAMAEAAYGQTDWSNVDPRMAGEIEVYHKRRMQLAIEEVDPDELEQVQAEYDIYNLICLREYRQALERMFTYVHLRAEQGYRFDHFDTVGRVAGEALHQLEWLRTYTLDNYYLAKLDTNPDSDDGRWLLNLNAVEQMAFMLVPRFFKHPTHTTSETVLYSKLL